jgi:glycosyltransferase involved in cell wall biosynthesis
MRIAYVLTQDLESPSGLGRYFPLARQLVRRGHQVHIGAIHPDFQSLQSRQLSLDGVDVNYVAPMHVLKQGSLKHYYGTFGLLSVTLQATWNLSADILRSDAEIIHIGKPHPMNSIAGVVGRMRSPLGLCVDCDDYEAGSMHFTATWQKWLVTQFEQRMPRVGRLVTVNTQFMHQKLIDWGVSEDKILYLPNGVDSERFSQTDAAKIDELRQAFGLTGRRVVAYIGSMSLPSHAVDLLLNAFSLILNSYPESKLLLVGGGGDYPAIVEMAAQMGLGSSVVFTGRVAPQEVPSLYQLADVTVDPVYDNDAARGRSPLKLFESWASSVPFVTSRVGDRTSFLETSLAGMLTVDCTAEAYAKSIMDVLSSAQLAETLRTRGLIEVQQYTWEHLAAKLEQAYKNLLPKSQNHRGAVV